MYVLRIDEATTNTRRDVDEVEFHDTGDGTPILLMQIGASALFCGDFQIHTRSQRYLIMAGTVVTGLVLDVLLLPVVEGCHAVCTTINSSLIQFVIAVIVGLTHIGE